MTDAPILDDLNLEDVPEIQLFEDNTEAELRIEHIELKTFEKDGNTGRFLNIRHSITTPAPSESVDNPAIFHTVFLPRSTDTKDQQNASKRRLIDYMEAFGVALDNMDTNSWVGSSGWVILKRDDWKGETKNVIGKVVKPA
jgi:hypothetical protein